jgi:UDP-N-acetylglucosamine transferase subunit ALG13
VIFVTVGTEQRPFDRLLAAVGDMQWTEPVVVQHGPSLVRPRATRYADYFSFPDMLQLIDEARVVISHAGVGSVTLALRAGKRPIIMPRLRENGEHVDDHQVLFAERLQSSGLAVAIAGAEELRHAVRSPVVHQTAPRGSQAALSRALRRYLIEETDIAPGVFASHA